MSRLLVVLVLALSMLSITGAAGASPMCNLQVCHTLCNKGIVC